MTLLEKLALKKQEAKEALNRGELELGRTLRQEAESIKAAIEEIRALDDITVVTPDPVRPPLPGTPAGAGPLPFEQRAPEPTPEPGSASRSVAYQRRFGEADAAVRSILTDLHGSDYIAKYWTQKAAFMKYMRYGEKALTVQDSAILREIVFTPSAIKAAMDQGIYEVGTLRSTMVEASDELGGYIVPVDFQARIIERLMGYTIVRPRATVISTSRDSVQIPVATGGSSQYTSAVRVTWVDETPTAGTAESNLTFGLETIPIHTSMIETPLSRNLLEDSVFDLEGYLAEKFAEAVAIDEDNQFLTGDGVGKPQGIIPGSANALSLSTANSGNANLLTMDGLIDLVYTPDSQYRANGVFIGEKATYQAIRKLKDGGGDYYWEPDQQVGQPPRLLGYPVLEQEAMPTIAATAFPLIFGDLRGYYIADRVGMSVERFLDSATARQNMVYFVMRRRLGGQCVETWRFALQYVSA